jgi:hypothetical protein
VVIFFACLDFEQKSSFLDGHDLTDRIADWSSLSVTTQQDG